MNGNNRQRDAAYVEQRVKQHVALALEALQDNEARARVIDWACDRFKIRSMAAPVALDGLTLGSIEDLAPYAEQNTRRFSPNVTAREQFPSERAPDPKDNDAVYAWLNALRI